MLKETVVKANKLLEIEQLATMYNGLVGPDALKRDDDIETIVDILTLTNLVIRFVDNEEMRGLERRYDEILGGAVGGGYVVNDFITIADDVLDMALQLQEQGNIIISWQPGKGAVVINGNR